MTHSNQCPEAVGPSDVVAQSLRFERMLSAIASSFIDIPIGRIDDAINDGLERIVTTLCIDRSTLSNLDARTGHFHSTHSWAAPTFLRVPTTVSSRTYPWALARFQAGLSVVFSRLADMPPEAVVDRAAYASIGVSSHVGMPVMVAGKFVAVLGFATLGSERAWPDEMVARMRLLADIFGSALARKRAQDHIDELLGFERVLADASIAVAGSPGPILDTQVHAALGAVATHLGVDSISLWRVASGHAQMIVTHQPSARRDLPAPELATEHDCPWIIHEIISGHVVKLRTLGDLAGMAARDADALGAAGVKALLAMPLHAQETVVGALTLSCLRDDRVWADEIVPRLELFGNLLLGSMAQRGAEQSARQSMLETTRFREHLAHLARVDAVGAMSTAIAHEINQPLMAIENYALAGRRRLAGSSDIDRAKVGELLEKIGGQAALANDVLNNLRTLVKRRETREARIDVPALIGMALKFADIEGRLQGVRIEVNMAADLPPILGDEVQIQQVVMNLAHNAMEAMAAVPVDQRVLHIESMVVDDHDVMVRVADSGPGIAAADEARVFEPFHTTKETGLGIGLSICRTIVEAHGGRLWHVPNVGGGAVFQFTLPKANDGE